MSGITTIQIVLSVGGLVLSGIVAALRHREIKQMLRAVLDQGRRARSLPVIAWPIQWLGEASRAVKTEQPEADPPRNPTPARPSWFPGHRPERPTPGAGPSVSDVPYHHPPRHPGGRPDYSPPSRPEYQTRPDPTPIITRKPC